MKSPLNFVRLILVTLPALALSTGPMAGQERLGNPGPPGPLRHSRLPFGILPNPLAHSIDEGSSLPPRSERSVDLDCSVVNWTTSASKPILTLACPAARKPTPFRVYIQLSWMGSGDRPDNYRQILAPPKTATRFHSDSHGAYVWLRLRNRCQEGERADWIRFSELVCLEMVRER